MKFENLWKNFPADSVQSKSAMGPPSKWTLDNILLHFLIYYFVRVFIISIIQFLISLTLSWRRPLSYRHGNQWTGFYMITASVMKGLNMFYRLGFSFFSRTIFLTSVSFFINMLKLSVVKLVFILGVFL